MTDLEIPEFLRRPPETAEQAEARRKRNARAGLGSPDRIPITPTGKSMSKYDLPRSLDAAGKVLLKQIEQEKHAKAIARLNVLRESKGMKPIGTKEKALRAARAGTTEKPSMAALAAQLQSTTAAAPGDTEQDVRPRFMQNDAEASAQAQPDPAAQPAADQQESTTMETQTATADKKAKRVRKAKAAKPAKPAKAAKVAKPRLAKADGPSGKAAEVGKLAARPNGASRAELIELTGWAQQAWKWYFVNSKGTGFCQRFGYKLDVIEGKDGESRYKITKK